MGEFSLFAAMPRNSEKKKQKQKNVDFVLCLNRNFRTHHCGCLGLPVLSILTGLMMGVAFLSK